MARRRTAQNFGPADTKVTAVFGLLSRLTLLAVLLGLAGCASGPDPASDPKNVITPSGRLAARLIAEPHDAERHQETSKVFHHVHAPDGRVITKGVGGKFGHHRGLFLGWNRLRTNGQGFDFWHCNKNETQQLRAIVSTPETVDPSHQVVAIEWRGPNGDRVCSETRSITARDLGEAIVLDLGANLRFPKETRLAGDPQHAGQQFRALQMFAEDDGPEVAYVRPASAVPHGNDVWTDCEWIAAVLPLPDEPVTVLRLEGASNPGPTTWSTRPYGRFGATFTHTVPADEPLQLSWTYVIAPGARDAAWCERTVERLTADS